MKKKYFIVAALLATLTLIIFSCRQELFDQVDENAESEEIMEARQWYNSNRPEGVRLKSVKANRVNIGATPDWKHAFTTKHTAFTTVEVPLNTQKRFGYASVECENAFKQTGDQRYMSSTTFMVVAKEKKNKKTIGFLMTYVPDKEFREKTKFKPFKSSYLKWNKDYSGFVFYHDLDGNFINGWKFMGGKAVKTMKPAGFVSNVPVNLKSQQVCTTYYIKEYTQDCRGSYGYNPSTGEVSNVQETCGAPYLTDYQEWDECEFVEGDYEQWYWEHYSEGGTAIPRDINPMNSPTIIDKPCKQVSFLTDDAGYQEANAALFRKLDANKEYGYLLKIHPNSNGTNLFTYTYMEGDMGNAQGASIDIDVYINPDEKIDGFMHTHYDGLVPMFSADDVYKIYDLNANGKVNNLNTFTAQVVANQVEYVLKVADISVFKNFCQNNLNTEEKRKAFNNSLDGWAYMKDAEKGFLKLTENSGLKLFRNGMPGIFNSYELREILENSYVETIPCL